jgi:hypothetical protein
MAQPSSLRNTRILTHIYVRDSKTGFIRPCWANGVEIYCGVCQEGVIRPAVGAACPKCASTVARILEAA